MQPASPCLSSAGRTAWPGCAVLSHLGGSGPRLPLPIAAQPAVRFADRCQGSVLPRQVAIRPAVEGTWLRWGFPQRTRCKVRPTSEMVPWERVGPAVRHRRCCDGIGDVLRQRENPGRKAHLGGFDPHRILVQRLFDRCGTGNCAAWGNALPLRERTPRKGRSADRERFCEIGISRLVYTGNTHRRTQRRLAVRRRRTGILRFPMASCMVRGCPVSRAARSDSGRSQPQATVACCGMCTEPAGCRLQGKEHASVSWISRRRGLWYVIIGNFGMMCGQGRFPMPFPMRGIFFRGSFWVIPGRAASQADWMAEKKFAKKLDCLVDGCANFVYFPFRPSRIRCREGLCVKGKDSGKDVP
jgi:hypothetical protein